MPVWRNRRPCFGSLLLVAAVVVVGRGESGSQAPPLNNLQVTSFDLSALPPTFGWSLMVGFELAAVRYLLLPINPCPLFSFSSDLFVEIKKIRRSSFLPFLWSHRRIGLGQAHGFLCNFMVLSPSFPGDVSLPIICAGRRPIYIWSLTSQRRPLTSSSEARSAVPGWACSSVWPLVVLVAFAGKFGPSQRACDAGDVVNSRFSTPVLRFVPGSLKMPCNIGGVLLVATNPRRRRGDLVGGHHAWCVHRHARLRSFASATSCSPETSSASICACLHVPSKTFFVIFVSAEDVSVTCGSISAHPCTLA